MSGVRGLSAPVARARPRGHPGTPVRRSV